MCARVDASDVTGRRRLRFVRAQVAWMLGVALLLSVVDLLDYDLFFLASLFGLLVLVTATEPSTVTPRWRRRLRWLSYAGLAAFLALFVRRLAENVPRGLL
ncbi:MAG: hypothetical protein V5A60_06820 [Haloarculaceae archaeon]